MEVTEQTSPLAHTTPERYEELKKRILTTDQPPLLKPPTIGILAKIRNLLGWLNVKGAPETNHVSPLKDLLPKENEYPDPTPKK